MINWENNFDNYAEDLTDITESEPETETDLSGLEEGDEVDWDDPEDPMNHKGDEF